MRTVEDAGPYDVVRRCVRIRRDTRPRVSDHALSYADTAGAVSLRGYTMVLTLWVDVGIDPYDVGQ